MTQRVISRSCVRGWVSPSDDWKTLSLSTGGKWIQFFESGKDKAAMGWAPLFISCEQESMGVKSLLPLRLLGYVYRSYQILIIAS